MNETFDARFESVRNGAQPVPDPRIADADGSGRVRLRQSLIGAIAKDILPACHEAVAQRGSSANDNSDPFLDRIARLAHMALNGERTADIHDYLAGQSLSHARKATMLGEAARRVGEGWVCDELDFVEVTMAVGRLQSTFRRLSQSRSGRHPARRAGSALVVAAPGEEHVFGLMVVEELFRSAGWSATLAMPSGPAELAARLSRGSYDAVCLSWSTDSLRNAVAQALPGLAKAARVVVAGGQASLRHRQWLAGQGVSEVCDDPYTALDFCRRNLLKQWESENFQAEPERAGSL